MDKKTVKLRSLEIGTGVPKICVPLVAETEDELEIALNALKCLKERNNPAALETVPFDMIEWRADFYRQIEDEAALKYALHKIREEVGDTPVLFTFRTKREGGNRSISEEDYRRLNENAAKSGLVDLVDVEVFGDEVLSGELIKKLHQMNMPVIGSFHDFDRTPPTDEILDRLVRMQEADVDITKIAVMPGCRMDVIRLMESAVRMQDDLGDRPCVTMSMGEIGVISRISGSFTGSAITFGTAGASSAPGQLFARDLALVRSILSKKVE